MFQNVLMDLKLLKKKQIFFLFSMSFGIFVSFQKKIVSLCLFDFIHMFTCHFIQMWIYVISFEYVEIISKY
jgi:hypothetical protein